MKIRMILVGGLVIIIIFLLFGFFNFSSQSQSQSQSQITEGMENNCSSIETSIEKQGKYLFERYELTEPMRDVLSEKETLNTNTGKKRVRVIARNKKAPNRKIKIKIRK